jgi:hypothetical protein
VKEEALAEKTKQHHDHSMVQSEEQNLTPKKSTPAHANAEHKMAQTHSKKHH